MNRRPMMTWASVLVGVAIAAYATGARAQACTAQATMLAFGAYDPTSPAPTDSIGSVTVACSGAHAQAISFKLMLARADGPRRLGQTAQYELFLDPAHTRLWEDCTGSTACLSDTLVLGSASARRSYPIYGRLLAHQPIRPGVLTGNVLVMLTY